MILGRLGVNAQKKVTTKSATSVDGWPFGLTSLPLTRVRESGMVYVVACHQSILSVHAVAGHPNDKLRLLLSSPESPERVFYLEMCQLEKTYPRDHFDEFHSFLIWQFAKFLGFHQKKHSQKFEWPQRCVG